MNPRLRALVFAVAAVAVASFAGAGCGAAERPPNVVLVTIDTLRADYTSVGGHPDDLTPALARIAGDGTTFERAWSGSSWTMPSMAMLLSGVPRSTNEGRLEGVPALAELLSARGYQTAGYVANALLVPEKGYDRGFDEYAVRAADAREWSGEELVERGLGWLEARDPDRPAFLFLHLFDPHYPYTPPTELVDAPKVRPERRAAFASALPEEERYLLTDEAYRGIETLIARYEGEVRRADRALERLDAGLERLGLAEDTLLVITSDHGEGLWQRAPAAGETRKAQVHFPALYYSHGAQLYTEQVNVPLVLRGPGIAQGTRSAADVSLIDVVPTVLELIDAAVPEAVRGRSLLQSSEVEERTIFSACSRATTVTVAGRWRLHVPSDHRVERFGAEPELYDLLSDPEELEPLEDPAREAELAAQVAAWRATHATEITPLDAAERARLSKLGYAEEADR